MLKTTERKPLPRQLTIPNSKAFPVADDSSCALLLALLSLWRRWRGDDGSFFAWFINTMRCTETRVFRFNQKDIRLLLFSQELIYARLVGRDRDDGKSKTLR